MASMPANAKIPPTLPAIRPSTAASTSVGMMMNRSVTRMRKDSATPRK